MDSAVVQPHKHLHPRLQQTNDNCNGPRVSFNKDVHVKRIGARPNENLNFGSNGDRPQLQQQPQYKRELPHDRTKEQLIKEAEQVIAQSERIKCTVDTPDSLAGIRLQEKLLEDRKFNSLPHRKKKSKPLGRSVSDASQKKHKRPSIFSIFSKRSDPSLNKGGNTVDASINSSGSDKHSSAGGDGGKRARKPIGRSKSDVGYNSSDSAGNSYRGRGPQNQTFDRKRLKIPDNDESMTKPKKKSQLSPISENPSAEKYFGYTADERRLLRNTKSEEKTTKRLPLTRTDLHPNPSNDLEQMLNDRQDADDNNMMPTKTTSTINNTNGIPTLSRSLENLHCSQLPQEKLPLTKGIKVDGMVKRLSMERFSPPLHFNSPAFSYTRPTESIVYAQVLRDENGEKTKQLPANGGQPSSPYRTTHLNVREKSPYRDMFGVDMVDYKNRAHRDTSPSPQTISSKFRSEKYKEISQQNNNADAYTNSPLHFAPNRHRQVDIIKRNHSDEDEGLGFEEQKRYHDENVMHSRQSSCEPPIIPNLRPSYGSIEHLANRRKLLESKIHERTFDFTREPDAIKKLPPTQERQYSPKNKEREHIINIQRYDDHMPEKLNANSMPRKQWAKQPKYYPETNIDDEFCIDHDSLRREQERQRHKNYLEKEYRSVSPSDDNRVIDLGYIDQYNDSNSNNNHINVINNNANYKYRTKPRKLFDAHDDNEVDRYPNQFSIPVERERKKHQSFDKADSGIENDFKRDREGQRNGHSPRIRNFITPDNVKNITELFLKRECQHTESLHPSKKRYDFVFRERSIDDGSHFDPHLDKYPEQKNRNTLSRKSPDDTKKNEKKFGSLKKMKEMFSLSSKKKQSPAPFKDVPASTPKETIQRTEVSRSPSVTHNIDIATRRRLSTPKASPLPKRNLSQKSSKMSHVSSHHSSDVSSPSPPKSGWFKSLERLSRKNKAPEAKKESSSTVKRSNTLNRPTYQRTQSPSPDSRPPVQQNLRFFGDTDLESVDASISKATTINSRTRKSLNSNASQSAQNSRQSSAQKAPIHIVNGQQNVRNASSMQHLNRDFRSKYLPDLSESTSENENVNTSRISHQTTTAHQQSANANPKHKHRRQYHSMEYLENQKRHEPVHKHHSNELSDISSHRSSRLAGRDRDNKHSLNRSMEKVHRNALQERNGRSSSETRQLPPIGPTKPAREFDRRRALSNDRILESSGTEGESSQQSVVYLHATTIGHIPQPYAMSSRRSSKSRDELSSIKSKSTAMPPQPMTRTVSRSVSMLAPWTPRHISDGYEINYSQTMQNNKKKTPNTLKKDNMRKARSRDDVSSLRNSSVGSSRTLPTKNKK